MPINKNNNNNNNNENLNLDSYHEKIMSNIEKNEKKIPEYHKMLKELEDILKKDLSKKELTIDKELDIKDKIEYYKTEIKKIKKSKKKYLLSNSQHIFDYFEQKKNISEDVNNRSKNKIDLDFFFNQSDNTSINTNTNTSVKNDIIDKYFQNVINSVNINQYYFDSNKCEVCNNGELVFIENEGVIICNKCYTTNKYYIENDKPNYREPPKEVCFYAYKRINHLREILAQFQAKETTLIPDEVIENIKNQIKKERIDFSELTNKKTKEILKNLRYNKYYEHIPFIKEKLGIKPPIMSQELEEKLCNLFTEIQPVYAKYCPKDRVNFLNYYYTIYKLCELLGERQFLPYFPMLKDREKRMEQDTIWKKICRELNWEFIPTI